MVVWALRAATPMAALFGGMVCLLVTSWTEYFGPWAEVHSGLMPLMALFVLTFAATKAGKSRKQAAGLAESRRGRSTAQIVANLGAAGLAVVAAFRSHWSVMTTMRALDATLLAALAEATADTVSSEIGAAFGGRPFLVTTFKRVEAGTDGAVSLIGTVAGLLAAALVVLVGMWSMSLNWRLGLSAWIGGFVGLWLDSLLGATVERRGWLGNDLVNFLSTVVGGLAALGVAILFLNIA